MPRYGYTTAVEAESVYVNFKVDKQTWFEFENRCLDKGMRPHQILRNCIYNYVVCSIDLEKKGR